MMEMRGDVQSTQAPLELTEERHTRAGEAE